jgi:hypothetical protein
LLFLEVLTSLRAGIGFLSVFGSSPKNMDDCLLRLAI